MSKATSQSPAVLKKYNGAEKIGYGSQTVDSALRAQQIESFSAAMQVDWTNHFAVKTVGFYAGWSATLAGPRGGATYHRDGTTGTASTAYADNGGFFDAAGSGFSISDSAIRSVSQFGAYGDGVTDDGTAIQNAIDSFTPGLQGGGIVRMDHGCKYTWSSGLVVPPNVTLDCVSAECKYSGTGVAIELGTSDTVLSYYCKALNINLKLETKTSVGVRLRGTANAVVTGYIEGYTAVIDNTRTNVGVDIDGVDVSSFFNEVSVICNHLHEGFRLGTTGTIDPTNQNFVNCSVFGDQTLDDTSIGFNFGGLNYGGQGTVISGGNIEQCNTGILLNAGAGSVSVLGTRFEIIVTATAWKVDFINGCAPCTFVGLQGIGSTYMESASGFRNFSSAAHSFTDESGAMRLNGFSKSLNAKSFIGLGGVTPEIWFDGNSDAAIMADSDSSGTGRMIMQPGRGSPNTGASVILNSHSSNSAIGDAGDCIVGPSLGVGAFKVAAGLGENIRMQVDQSPAAGHTSLYVYDADTATLHNVSVGAADSGGAGYKVLRIPN